jgi:hypothetical protein
VQPRKRLLIHVGAFNLSLIFRSLLGAGTPRKLRNRLAKHCSRYLDAVFETDEAKIPIRVYEAIAAIEQRLLRPMEACSSEGIALQDAQSGIPVLKFGRELDIGLRSTTVR